MLDIKKHIVPVVAAALCSAVMASCTPGDVTPEVSPEPTPVQTISPTPTPDVIQNAQVKVENVEKRGYCGQTARWEFGDNGKLVIYGTDKINDYEAEVGTRAPWAELDVNSIYINEGISYIGNFAFYGMAGVTDISVPETVCQTGYDAFDGTAWYENQTEQFVTIGDGILIKYNGASRDVSIPYGVKFISNAFKENTDNLKHDEDIASIKMPDSVTEIGSHAFYSCRFLHGVSFSAKLEVIGDSAFENSGIRSDITLPENVRSIGSRAFAMCNELYSIKLPASLETISDFAFADSNINRFSIPENVSNIGKNPFLNCQLIKKFEVSDENEFFATDSNGILYTKDLSVLIACPDGLGYNNPVISSQVTEIKPYAFLSCNAVEQVSISDNVKKIGDSAFGGSVILKVKANSAAQRYAHENGYAYEKF